MNPDDLRLGGTLGMLGVILFVISLILGSGQFIQASVSLPDNDFESSGAFLWNNEHVERLADAVNLLVVPLCFLMSFESLRKWMKDKAWSIDNGLYSLSLLAMSFWLLSGIIRVFIIPAAPLASANLSLSENTLSDLLQMLASGVYDGAYFLLSLSLCAYGVFLFRALEGKKGRGIQTISISLTTLCALLLGPYDSVNFLNVYALGAPIFAMFGISLDLLRLADSLSAPQST